MRRKDQGIRASSGIETRNLHEAQDLSRAISSILSAPSIAREGYREFSYINFISLMRNATHRDRIVRCRGLKGGCRTDAKKRLFGQLRVICSQKVPRSLTRTITQLQPSTSPLAAQVALSSCLLFVITSDFNEAETKASLELIPPLSCSSNRKNTPRLPSRRS